MYRNVSYFPKDGVIRLYTWDEQGNRIHIDSTYEPYIYLETNGQEDCKSLYNTKLKKRKFRSQFERSKYVKDNKGSRIFENLPVHQHYLIDMFAGKNEDVEFSKFDLRVFFLDIETYSKDGFPNPEEAKDTINVITIYDTLTKKFYTWGLKKHTSKKDNQVYIYCVSEEQLLERFLDFFEDNYPDISSGYNCESFDYPYIINRITKILGEAQTKRLSPNRYLSQRFFKGSFGRDQVKWVIDGISCVDYLQIYKRFCLHMRDSYKLGRIGEIELEESKTDYGDMSLWELADSNWDKFIEYNIQDVNLLVRLEEKLKYIELLRTLAYTGLTTFEAALGTVSVITGLCAIRARSHGKRIPTFYKDDSLDESFAGAFVKEPITGFQTDIISFDANSLYPNVMITLNLSPETKIGKIINKTDIDITIKHVSGREYKLSHKNFLEFIKKEQISISKAKVLFSQKEKGIIPEIADDLYHKRIEIKKLLKKTKKLLTTLDKNSDEYKKTDRLVNYYNIRQHTIKITINSMYGVTANKYSPISDLDLAESITLTGQAVIKETNNILKRYIQENIKSSVTSSELTIYNDTDSSYITIKDIVKYKNIRMLGSDGKITKEYYKEVEDIGEFLNKHIKEWATNTLFSTDVRFEFKREVIADSGIFLAKKRYVLHVLDEEGIPVDKFKYTGVSVVRSTMPTPIKPHVKKIIETMLITKDQDKTNKVFYEAYDLFKTLPLEDIAFVSGIKGYEKYAKDCSEFNTANRMPVHAKASYYYNILLDKFELDKKYEKIASGDKCRYFYIEQPNKYGIHVVGFKYNFPKEFNEYFKIDYEKMFMKIIFSSLEGFYKAVNWKLKEPTERTQTDVLQFLME